MRDINKYIKGRSGTFHMISSSYLEIILSISIFCFILGGCKKNLEVDTPVTNISTESAFKNDNTAAAVLTGLYAQISNNYFSVTSSPASTSLFEELSADNLVLYDLNSRIDLASYYQNSLEPKYTTTYDQTYWKNIYAMMYTINVSINALVENKELTEGVRNRLLGEAYFLRSFCYFYLVNIYGDVPLILTTDYTLNSKISRTATVNIYNQIISDLLDAEKLLDNNYVSGDVSKTSTDRLRPNLAAVNALQARVYLYQKNFVAAESAATKVINQSTLYSLVNCSEVFMKNSNETIWALQSVNLGYNTREGQFYTIPSTGPDYDRPVYASQSLLQSFELGDSRKDNWIGNVTVDAMNYSYPAKYKATFVDGASTLTEYTVVLRLAELYLIRAEARNEEGNINGAIEDLNIIRTRARAIPTLEIADPLPDLPLSLNQGEIRTAVLKERRVELFTEWGHRWFDLKRSASIDSVMVSAEVEKGGVWANYKSLYPIPISDILLNTALSQNPGYTN